LLKGLQEVWQSDQTETKFRRKNWGSAKKKKASEGVTKEAIKGEIRRLAKILLWSLKRVRNENG